MRLDKTIERLDWATEGSMFACEFVHYMISSEYLGRRRALLYTATDKLPRKHVAGMLWQARKQLRVEFARLDRKRKKAAER